MQANHADSKSLLRQHMSEARKALTPAQAKERSVRIQERVLALDVWRQAEQVMLYSAVRGEVATGMLISSAFAAGKEVLLPRCRPEERGVMDAVAIKCLEDLRPGRFGIPEPDPASCPSLGSCLPDLILVPAVSFDRRGYRLGYGGGYYDRFLSKLHLEVQESGAAIPPTVGLAYELQLVESLPNDEWDHPLSCICTEEGCWWPDLK